MKRYKGSSLLTQDALSGGWYVQYIPEALNLYQYPCENLKYRI